MAPWRLDMAQQMCHTRIMDLTSYIDSLRADLLAAVGADETALAERLSSAVAAATRLTMFDVLSDAADEITRDLAPGTVEVRVRDRNPYFVVTASVTQDELRGSDDQVDVSQTVGDAASTPPNLYGKQGAVGRINFRPPEQLKERIEVAAAREGLSVNAWLVHVTSAVLATDDGSQRTRQNSRRVGHFTGWVG
jgi:hypothetical protein